MTTFEGYDYKFIEEPPDSLKCLICLLVAKDPQQHSGCGNLFCKTCIARYTVKRNDCPHCRQPASKSNGFFNDFKSAQEVKSLLIFCTNAYGWRGELRDIQDHLRRTCDNVLVICQNKCQNGETRVLRKDLEDHLERDCENTLLACPNECFNGRKTILRKVLDVHLRECLRRKVFCIDCKQTYEVQYTSDHQNKKCLKAWYSCPHCEVWGQYDERTTTHLEVCPNVKIQCPKCSAEIYRYESSTHSLSCSHEKVLCRYQNIGCQERPLRKDANKHESDALYHLNIATEKVLHLNNVLSPITFRITDYTNKKYTNQWEYSQPFYTPRSRYKLCVCVLANEKTGSHISVYAHLMKGDCDDFLTWPFTGTVTIELLNQLEDKNHHKRIVTFLAENECSQKVVIDVRGKGYGYEHFIPHAHLYYRPKRNCQYLKGDTLVFRASAEDPTPG